MSLSKQKQKKLEVLVAKGNLSDRAIAKEVQCDPKTVRNYIDKLNLEKSSLSSLANDEIQNIIIGKEIEEKKSSLSPHQKDAYNEVLLTEAQSMNLALNANHILLEKIYNNIEKGTKLEKMKVGEGVDMLEEVAHGSSDFVNHAKAIQTTSDNLGITQRHSNSQVTVHTQNNLSNENMVVTKETVLDTLEEFGKNY